MPLQLVLRLGDRSASHRLPDGEHVLGSSADCDVRVAHPAISRRHARLRVRGDEVEVEDLGSRNGTRVAGGALATPRRVRPGERLTFGTVEAVVEKVATEDQRAAVRFASPPPRIEPVVGAAPTTASVGSLHTFTLQSLPSLLARLGGGASVGAAAREIGAALFEALPCARLTAVEPTAGGEPAVVFTAERGTPSGGEDVVTAANDAVALHVAFAHRQHAEVYAGLVEAAAALVVLAAARGQRSVRRPAIPPAERELPRPPSLVPEVRALYRDAWRVAQGDVSVLVTGESGTGKEVFARYLHACSPRGEGPFVALNCAALPHDLLESELFGVEAGVATGVSSRPGKFELAHDGTLFLDEVGDMAPETQARILRVLQEREVFRVGGAAARPANVRVVAATNRDIDALLAGGLFRLDLYHRIADWVVRLPALRQRRADVPNLAAHFLQEEAVRLGRRVVGISQAALETLAAQEWPGNVRQLQREMARAALFLEDGEMLQTRHLQIPVQPEAPARTLRERVERTERAAIREALVAHRGNLSAVARELGIGRSRLYRRLRELGLDVGDRGGGALAAAPPG